jgi:uncharacterized membrane protein YkoI
MSPSRQIHPALQESSKGVRHGQSLKRNRAKIGGQSMTSKTKLLLAWVVTAAAAGLQATLLADEPKNEPPIRGTIQLQQEGERQATYSGLAKITLQQATTIASNAQSGNISKAELQNEDGFLVYNVVVVSQDKKIHEIKVDAGNGSILRTDVDSTDRETEHEESD